MLAALRSAAPANVHARLARAEEVEESWGRFTLATAGRAFHWFDGEVVMARLARVTAQLALLGDPIRQSDGATLVLALARELLGELPPPTPPRRYAEILADSPFSQVERISVEVERTWTRDSLIGLAYSTSVASPERVGSRREEFERAVPERLEPVYHECVTVDLLLGRRPSA
jgi:hypothetical protein